jgi:hypothetical protein
MERNVNDNASPNSNPDPIEREVGNWEPGGDEDEGWWRADPEPVRNDNSPAGGQGPCLYLGPVGQRCSRPALAGGFCAKHRTGALEKKRSNPSRVVVAIAAIAGVLWPILLDLIREILRWIHTH